MRGSGRLFEGTRMFSIVAAIGLAGGALAFLFHDVDAVEVTLAGPAFGERDDLLEYQATIVVPPGQRLPLAGLSFVVQDPATSPPSVVDLATCWGEAACGEALFHAGPRILPSIEIEFLSASAPPTEGPLSVWVEGYGRSSATGYGTEVEPQRKLTANDILAAEGVAYGRGYGGDEAVTILYAVRIHASDLAPGQHQLALLVETESRDMGGISSPVQPLFIGEA